jgi:hypothetical protein
MIEWLLSKFTKDARTALNPIKSKIINGVLFKFKRLDVLDYLTGANIMLAAYDTYKINPTKTNEASLNKKAMEHYREVFLACVIKPEFVRKPESDKIHIDEIFADWDTANKLYNAIIEFTYGKKKISQNDYLSKD